ncbi:chromate transport protein ChrA [Pseudomonas sp. W2I6]|nr:chromate transport protein ChrA [Pseudomonas sp. W2I6]
MQSVLFHLMIQCALWSLMAIGGNTVALSDIHRYTVTDMNWITDAQFVAFFALPRPCPGPMACSWYLSASKPPGCPAPWWP